MTLARASSCRHFLLVKPQLGHRGPVVDREQDGVAGALVLVPVPGPGRDVEQVSRAPLDALAFDRGHALALEDVVAGGTVVAVRLGRLAPLEQLDVPGDRG